MKYLLILLFYINTYIFTYEYFNINNIVLSFTFYHLFTFILVVFILREFSKKNVVHNLPFIIIFLILLIGYDFKYYLFIYLFSSDNDSIHKLAFIFKFVSDPLVLLQVKELILISFVILFIVIKQNKFYADLNFIKNINQNIDIQKFTVFLMFIILYSIFTAFLQKMLGIEFTGKQLPFYISPIIIYSRSFLIPMVLMIILIMAFFRFRMHKRLIGVIVISIILHSFASTILMSSKGYVIIALLQLFFLSLLLKDINKKKLLIKFLPIIVFAILLYPLMDLYRNFRVSNDVGSIFETIIGAFELLIDKDPFIVITVGFLMILLRIIGTESLIQSVDYINTHKINFSLDWIVSIYDDKRSFVQFFTQDIAGFGDAAIHSHATAPGLIGFLYTSIPNYFFFSVVFYITLKILMRMYIIAFNSKLHVKPLLIIYTLFIILSFCDGGNVKKLLITGTLMIAISLLIELILFRFNLLGKRRRSNNVSMHKYCKRPLNYSGSDMSL
jgi:hypothetical protein